MADPSSTAVRGRVVRASVTAASIELAEHAQLVSLPSCGAVATFAGVIRDHDHGRDVTSIDYSAHPSAERILGEVAEGLIADYAVHAVAVTHRIGPLGIGEVALAVAVSSPHRGEAFAAVAELVDRVKAQLPVWKHQFFTDGTDEWVNCCV